MNRELEFSDPIKKEYYDSIEEERIHYKINTGYAFDRIKKYETELNKNIQEFTLEEVTSMYERMLNKDGVSASTVLNTHFCVKFFVEYCVQQNICDNNIFNDITGPQIKGLNQKKSVTLYYGELQEKLDLLINPVDKFIILGIFEGILGESFCEIGYSTLEDSNKNTKEIWLAKFENGIINKKGRIFKASPELFEYAEQSTNTYVYLAQIVEEDYKVQGNEIVKRSISSANAETLNSCRVRINRKASSILTYIGLDNLKINDLHWAGVYYTLCTAQIKLGLDTIDEVFKTEEYLQIKENYQLHDRKFVTIDALRKRGYLEK